MRFLTNSTLTAKFGHPILILDIFKPWQGKKGVNISPRHSTNPVTYDPQLDNLAPKNVYVLRVG